MNETRWIALMGRLGFKSNTDTHNKLVTHYSQKHRSYHNTNHINAVLQQLDQARDFADDFNAIELAVWFHDAIYNVFSSENELNSAIWASEFLQDNSAGKESSDRVYSLIMATLHNAAPESNDARIMVDIDLSILGSNPEDYNIFEKSIREEYKLIPGFVFKKKRKIILQGFLERENIYSHQYFHEKYEINARSNLANAIHHL